MKQAFLATTACVLIFGAMSGIAAVLTTLL